MCWPPLQLNYARFECFWKIIETIFIMFPSYNVIFICLSHCLLTPCFMLAQNTSRRTSILFVNACFSRIYRCYLSQLWTTDQLANIHKSSSMYSFLELRNKLMASFVPIRLKVDMKQYCYTTGCIEISYKSYSIIFNNCIVLQAVFRICILLTHHLASCFETTLFQVWPFLISLFSMYNFFKTAYFLKSEN